MAGSSKTSVISAIGGNALVMVSKFVAFGITGSGAMLSEGIHSAADVLNQVLLLIGLTRAQKGRTSQRPVGHGREQYIWALISAVGIFFLGCGVTVYHGVESLLHPPEELGDLTWAIVVLIFSLVVEGAIFFLALSGLRKEAAGRPFLAFLKTEADPSAAAVLLEDAAACLGIIFALTGIVLTQVTGQLFWDGLASISVGLLLGAVAIYLIARNHSLLVGEAAPREVSQQVKAIINESAVVEDVVAFQARKIDLKTYDIMAHVEFDGYALATRFEPQLKEAYDQIQDWEQFRDFAGQYADDVIQAVGDEVDRIEEKIKAEVPEARFIDLETN
jgi:zinc transporter 9